MPNFARRQPPAVPPGTVFECCNFSQAESGTALKAFAGVKITFRGCNLVNCEIDKAWTVERCNTAQVVIPPEPTPRELLLQEKADAVAERARLADRIDEIDDLTRTEVN